MYKIAIGIDLDWPFEHHYDIIRGIVDYGKENNIECVTEPWLEVSENIENIPGDYDGIIARVTPALARYCEEHDIPLLNVWENSPEKNIPKVVRDFNAISRKMVNYFATRGFQNIAFFKRSDDSSAAEMADHFVKEMTRQNISIEENTVVEAEFPSSKETWDSFNKTLSDWLLNQTFPMAICTSDYLFARYIIEWCKKHNISVPDDIAILSGSDNDLICERLEPTISHIENRFVEVGYEAAGVLHKMLDGEFYEKHHKVFPGKLTEMKSTDVEPVDDRIIAGALRFIRDNTSSQIQVIDVADSLNIARRSLERRFRKLLDRTINEEILRSKMDCVQKLLLNSDKTISEIAQLTGISSGQRLSQLFRKHMGISITEFRQNNLDNQLLLSS